MRKNESTFIILVTGILNNKQGDILLVKRSKYHKTFKGFWQLPEGKMETEEQPNQTLIREIKEETNLELKNLKLLSIYSTIAKLKNKKYHLLRIIMKAKWNGTLALSKEHDAYRWMSIEKAVKMTHLVDGTKEILGNIK